jgi:glycosyltransferase involved in cell wall biosynthesis
VSSRCELAIAVPMPAERRRVALVQGSIGYDGSSQTLAHVIRLLNERAITPALLTFSSESQCARMEENSGGELQYSLVPLRRPAAARGHQFEQVAVARLAQPRLEHYDVVYTSDTSVYGFSSAQVVLRLVCFPLERVPEYEERYRRLAMRAYARMGKVAMRWARRSFVPHGVWIANSNFTAGVMRETYGLKEDAVTVVYPPVAFPVEAPRDRERVVVSIGGFHADKRQLEQIALAARNPDIDFVIAGTRRSASYFERCRRAARGVSNVHLLPDAPAAEFDRVLRRAKVFLHSKRFEHFGMSTVEGIAGGCVPVVHNSGGQREVVPYPELRFDDERGAESLIRGAVEGNFDSLLPGLQRHVASFGVEAFDMTMGSLLDQALAAVSRRGRR